MKKLITAILCFILPAGAVAQTVTVSIPPQKYIVEKIAGESVSVNVMVPKGSDPHVFAPKSGQIRTLADSDLYLGIGFPFEAGIVPQIIKSVGDIKVVMTQKGIDFIEEDHDHGDHEEDGHIDPHVWTSPKSMAVVAENTYNALIEQYPQHKSAMQKGYDALREEIARFDADFKKIFKSGSKKFLVYHPAFGYLARDYGLTQIAVERDGKEPKAAELKEVIDTARRDNIKLFIIQPQQSAASALTVARELNIGLTVIDILDEDWAAMMGVLRKAFEAAK